MVITEVKIDLEDVRQKLSYLGERQIPFVVAKSLTKTAQEAQANVRQHINQKFVIRKKSGGFEKSIVVSPALKNKLEARVFTMARFAYLQQVGGIRKSIGRNLAIPSYQNIKDVPARKSAKTERSKTFIMKLKSGDAIARRDNKKLEILYFLRRRAEIDKRLNMLEIATNTAKNRFEFHFKNIVRETF